MPCFVPHPLCLLLWCLYRRFSLDELMTALAHGYNTAVNDDQERSGSQTTDQNRGQPQNHHHHHHHHRPLVVGGWNNDQYSDSMANDRYPGSTNNAYTGSNNHYAESDSENLLDVIPAPLPFRGGGGEGQGQGEDGMGTQHKEEARAPTGGGRGSAVGPDMLANVHMRLLDFLAWDRTRSARCYVFAFFPDQLRLLFCFHYFRVCRMEGDNDSFVPRGFLSLDASRFCHCGLSSGIVSLRCCTIRSMTRVPHLWYFCLVSLALPGLANRLVSSFANKEGKLSLFSTRSTPPSPLPSCNTFIPTSSHDGRFLLLYTGRCPLTNEVN